jgi:hypothetical protein
MILLIHETSAASTHVLLLAGSFLFTRTAAPFSLVFFEAISLRSGWQLVFFQSSVVAVRPVTGNAILVLLRSGTHIAMQAWLNQSWSCSNNITIYNEN